MNNRNKAFFESRGYCVEHLSPGSSCWCKSKGESYIIVDGDGDFESSLPPDVGPFRIGFYKNCGDNPELFEIVEGDRLVETLDRAENALEKGFEPTSPMEMIERLLFVGLQILRPDHNLPHPQNMSGHFVPEMAREEKVIWGGYTILPCKIEDGEQNVDGHDQPILVDGYSVLLNGREIEKFTEAKDAVKSIIRTEFELRLKDAVDGLAEKQDLERQAQERF